MDTRRSVGFWLLSGAIGAMLTIAYVLPAVLDSPDPVITIRTLLEAGRVSALQPDLNAAGSYFALFLLPALVIAVRCRVRWMTVTMVPLVAIAFVAARSRAAFVAVVLVACAAWVVGLRRKDADSGRGTYRAIAAVAVFTIAVATLVLGLFAATSRSNVAVGTALQYRLEMAYVAAEAIERYPLFGVGLGDYIRATRRFIDADVPALARYAPNSENAHNNVLQIAVELGVPAALAFLWLVVPMAARGLDWRDPRPSPELQGMALGLAAFLISALFGHPLLVTQVGSLFFIALGVAAGLAPAGPPRSEFTTVATISVAVFYAASLVWRIG